VVNSGSEKGVERIVCRKSFCESGQGFLSSHNLPLCFVVFSTRGASGGGEGEEAEGRRRGVQGPSPGRRIRGKTGSCQKVSGHNSLGVVCVTGHLLRFGSLPLQKGLLPRPTASCPGL